jgi:GNAT superfamily N-acetyltransferase
MAIQIGVLKRAEVAAADELFRLAFSKFIGIPQNAFLPGRDFIGSRFGAAHIKALAARDEERVIGASFVTRWGSFGILGPLIVHPDYWDKGIGQKLLERSVKVFDEWPVLRSGLFTFPHSAKHIGLYQKYGFWPQYLVALLSLEPKLAESAGPVLLSALPKPRREEAIAACARLSNRFNKGLDLTSEIRLVLSRHTGDVVLAYTGRTLSGFAVCSHGPGSEGGNKICYIKFATARDAAGFEKLLEACEQFAASRSASVEAGMNLAHENAYRLMRSRGYRPKTQGVAMLRPHTPAWNRTDLYAIQDWR